MERHDPADLQHADVHQADMKHHERAKTDHAEHDRWDEDLADADWDDVEGEAYASEEAHDEPHRPPLDRRAPRTPWAALALDATLVVLFAGLGRLSHAEGLGLLGLIGTAAPFLAGTLAGWAVLLWRRPARPASLTGGAIVWLSTVVIGMIVRVMAGGSTAVSFVLVSLVVTGLFLLGWRALGQFLVRRAAS